MDGGVDDASQPEAVSDPSRSSRIDSLSKAGALTGGDGCARFIQHPRQLDNDFGVVALRRRHVIAEQTIDAWQVR
jgi:hypothetical protein